MYPSGKALGSFPGTTIKTNKKTLFLLEPWNLQWGYLGIWEKCQSSFWGKVLEEYHNTLWYFGSHLYWGLFILFLGNKTFLKLMIHEIYHHCFAVWLSHINQSLLSLSFFHLLIPYVFLILQEVSRLWITGVQNQIWVWCCSHRSCTDWPESPAYHLLIVGYKVKLWGSFHKVPKHTYANTPSLSKWLPRCTLFLETHSLKFPSCSSHFQSF